MIDFFIISDNKQLPTIRKNFKAKIRKFKSQKFNEIGLFMSDNKPILSNDDQILKEAESFMTSVITS